VPSCLPVSGGQSLGDGTQAGVVNFISRLADTAQNAEGSRGIFIANNKLLHLQPQKIRLNKNS
jgi:hypothetical protein